MGSLSTLQPLFSKMCPCLSKDTQTRTHGNSQTPTLPWLDSAKTDFVRAEQRSKKAASKRDIMEVIK